MSPIERATRLAREVDSDLERLGKAVDELLETARLLAPGCPAGIRMGVAGYLHSVYTGCESILQRIARAAGALPSGPEWHKTLLIESAAPIQGVRPPVIRVATAKVLNGLLEFRHFFRVMYGVDLEMPRLREHVEAAPGAFRMFREDMLEFLRLLETSEAPSPPPPGGASP